jgi:choline-glycine betaine transporter
MEALASWKIISRVAASNKTPIGHLVDIVAVVAVVARHARTAASHGFAI